MGLKRTPYSVDQTNSLIVEIGRMGMILERLGQELVDHHGVLSKSSFLDCFEDHEDLIPETIEFSRPEWIHGTKPEPGGRPEWVGSKEQQSERPWRKP